MELLLHTSNLFNKGYHNTYLLQTIYYPDLYQLDNAYRYNGITLLKHSSHCSKHQYIKSSQHITPKQNNSSSCTDGSTLTLATGRSLFGCDREWSATFGCVNPAHLRARLSLSLSLLRPCVSLSRAAGLAGRHTHRSALGYFPIIMQELFARAPMPTMISFLVTE